jgi:hypothetical protein
VAALCKKVKDLSGGAFVAVLRHVLEIIVVFKYHSPVHALPPITSYQSLIVKYWLLVSDDMLPSKAFG